MNAPAPAAPRATPAHGGSARAAWITIGASLIVILVLLVLLGRAGAEAWQARYTLDDAFAFCRYADHLWAGWGLAWNPGGPQTFGCTSLLYAFWIALLRALTSLTPWQVLAIGSFVPGLLALVAMGLACGRVAGTSVLHRPIVGCGCVALAACVQPAFFFHIQTGMDTTTAILTNALLILAAVDPRLTQSAKRLALVACLAYLTYLARPDNLLYALLFPSLRLVLDSGSDARRRWRALAVFATILGVLLLADAGVKTLVFGNPLPLPFYAKRGDFYAGYIGAPRWNPVYATQDFLLYQAVPLVLLVLTVGRHSWQLALAALVPMVLTFAYLGTAIQIMGYEARFYYPAMPFVLVAAYRAVDTALPRLRGLTWRTSLRRLGARSVALAVLGLLVFPGGNKAALWYEAYCQRRHPDLRTPGVYGAAQAIPPLDWVPSMRAITRLVGNCPPKTLWAMSEHGFVGAMFPNVTIIDFAGLHDRDTLTGQSIVAHALAQKPDVIWFPHSHYTGMVAALEASPVLAEDYDYWPGAFGYGLAVRKQSPWRAEIDRALHDVWRACYQAECPPPALRAGKREQVRR